MSQTCDGFDYIGGERTYHCKFNLPLNMGVCVFCKNLMLDVNGDRESKSNELLKLKQVLESKRMIDKNGKYGDGLSNRNKETKEK